VHFGIPLNAVRSVVTRISFGLMAAFRIAPEKRASYRDLCLSVVVLVPTIYANVPLFDLVLGEDISLNEAGRAALWFFAAFGVGLLSPNWGHVLAVAYFFLALRGVVAFLANSNATTLLLVLAYAGLALTFDHLGGQEHQTSSSKG